MTEEVDIKFRGSVAYEMRFEGDLAREIARAAAFHEMRMGDYIRQVVRKEVALAQVRTTIQGTPK
jgi:hypothetical protein